MSTLAYFAPKCDAAHTDIPPQEVDVIVMKSRTVGATALVAALAFGGVAAASAGAARTSQVNAATVKSFTGYGPTSATAIDSAWSAASDLGCSPISTSKSAVQLSDGTWRGNVNAWCGVL